MVKLGLYEWEYHKNEREKEIANLILTFSGLLLDQLKRQVAL